MQVQEGYLLACIYNNYELSDDDRNDNRKNYELSDGNRAAVTERDPAYHFITLALANHFNALYNL